MMSNNNTRYVLIYVTVFFLFRIYTRYYRVKFFVAQLIEKLVRDILNIKEIEESCKAHLCHISCRFKMLHEKTITTYTAMHCRTVNVSNIQRTGFER